MQIGHFRAGGFLQIQYGKHENDTRIYTTTIGGRQTCKSNE